jgi:hypothetical protein
MCSQAIPPQPDEPESLAALEQEITRLATQIHAATCRWLCLVGEYDAREGWAHWGARSCAHWVSWQCGVAPGAAREHVRVARRLRELPLIRAAFSEGQLSYSKVRALTRVNGIERERDLLELARHATASQLERLVRAYRGVVASERAPDSEEPQRWLALSHDDDGSLLLRGRLPADQGALLMAALDAARDQLGATDVPAETAGASSTLITSSTGRTVAPPTSRTWSNSASTTPPSARRRLHDHRPPRRTTHVPSPRRTTHRAVPRPPRAAARPVHPATTGRLHLALQRRTPRSRPRRPSHDRLRAHHQRRIAGHLTNVFAAQAVAARSGSGAKNGVET